MLTVARALSALAVVSTVVAIDAWRVHLLPWGFEATAYVAGLSLFFAVLFTVAVLVVAAVAARAGLRAQLMPLLLMSSLCLLGLVALVIDFFLEALLGLGGLDDRFSAARLAMVAVAGASARPAVGTARLEN